MCTEHTPTSASGSPGNAHWEGSCWPLETTAWWAGHVFRARRKTRQQRGSSQIGGSCGADQLCLDRPPTPHRRSAVSASSECWGYLPRWPPARSGPRRALWRFCYEIARTALLRMQDLRRRRSSTRVPSAPTVGRRRPHSPVRRLRGPACEPSGTAAAGGPTDRSARKPTDRNTREPTGRNAWKPTGRNAGITARASPQPVRTSTPPTVRLPRRSTRNLPCSRSLVAGAASWSVTLTLFR